MIYTPPVVGPVSCDYACHVAAGRTGGIDYAVPTGTPVKASADGKVTISTNWGGTAGIYIEMAHPDGHHSRYLHLSKRYPSVGAIVPRGQVIGLSGNSGNSIGPHLHFDVGTAPGSGYRIDPMLLFNQQEDADMRMVTCQDTGSTYLIGAGDHGPYKYKLGVTQLTAMKQAGVPLATVPKESPFGSIPTWPKFPQGVTIVSKTDEEL